MWQAIAFIDQQFFGLREDVFVTGDFAQLFNYCVAGFALKVCGHVNLRSENPSYCGERDDTLRARLAGSAGALARIEPEAPIIMKTRLIFSVLFALLVMTATFSTHADKPPLAADLIIINGKIHTMDQSRPL